MGARTAWTCIGKICGRAERRSSGCIPYYTERERAALAWTEAVTLITKDHAQDAVYEQARAQFSEKEICDLTLAVAAINAWNRLVISARTVPGGYQAGSAKAAR
jgi:alkylhydroperoxidase family enzyme